MEHGKINHGDDSNTDLWPRLYENTQGIVDVNIRVDQRLDIPNRQTGTSYTLQSSDVGKTVTMNNADANVLTIPLDTITTNAISVIIQLGVGITSITAAAGVKLNGVVGGSCDIISHHTGVTIDCLTDNEFLIYGNMNEVL